MNHKRLLYVGILGLFMGSTPIFAESNTVTSDTATVEGDTTTTSQTHSFLEELEKNNASFKKELDRLDKEQSHSSATSETTSSSQEKQRSYIPINKDTQIIKGHITFEGGGPSQQTDLDLKGKYTIPLKVTLSDGNTKEAEAHLTPQGADYYLKNIKKGVKVTAIEVADKVWEEYYSIQTNGENLTFSRTPVNCSVTFQNQGTTICPGQVTPSLKIDGTTLNQTPKTKKIPNISKTQYSYTYKVPTDKVNDVQFSVQFENQKIYEKIEQTNASVTYAVKTNEISGTIQFKDNTEKTRPELIKVYIYDGEKLVDTVTTSASEGWKYTSRKLPVNHQNGTSIKYTVKAAPIPFYENPKISGTTITYCAKWRLVPLKKVDVDMDMDNSKPLTGGILKIVDTATGDTILPLNGKLPVGHTYEISTLIPPLGYKAVNQPVTIKLLDDGTVEQLNGSNFKPVDQVQLDYKKIQTTTPSKPNGDFSSLLDNDNFLALAKHLGLSPKDLLSNLLNQGLKLPDLLKLFGDGFKLPQLPDLSNLGSDLSLPDLSLPHLDSSLDLPDLSNLGSDLSIPDLSLPDLSSLDSGLSLPDLSNLGSDLPDLNFGSDLGLEPLSDAATSSDDLSNGNLGNFDDLLSSDSSSLLPQTGNKKQKGLIILGTAMIAAVCIYLCWRVILHYKSK